MTWVSKREGEEAHLRVMGIAREALPGRARLKRSPRERAAIGIKKVKGECLYRGVCGVNYADRSSTGDKREREREREREEKTAVNLHSSAPANITAFLIKDAFALMP